MPCSEQRCEIGRRHALEASTEPRSVGDPEQGVHQQGVEELLAELAMPQPVLAVAIRTERERVDEDGARSLELHVESGRVAQREAAPERVEVDVEMEEGRGLERRERPLVGPGDEGKARMLEDDRRLETEGVRLGLVEPSMGEEAPFRDEPREKACLLCGLEGGRCPPGDRPEDATAEDVDAAGRVAERPRARGAAGHSSRVSPGPAAGLRPKTDFSRFQ